MENNYNMRNKSSLKPISLAVMLAFGASSLSATAQDASDETKQEKKSSIERISVTAQKKVTPLQETPIAITAFSGESIENRGIEDISDLNNIAPNTLVVAPIGSSYNVGVTIRGLGTASPSLGIDPKVGIYVDGVYMARNSGAILEIIDLERVEVLRGPQGTLWGKNTTGGAISMTTQAPAYEFGFSQQFKVGNFGYMSSLTSINTGEHNGFSGKFTYLKSDEDGWAKNIFAGAKEKKLGAKETDAYRVALRYQGEDFSMMYNHDKTDGSSVSIPVQVSNVRSAFIDPAVPTLHMGTNTFYGGNVFSMMAANEFSGGRQEEFELDAHGREYVDISGHNLNIEWNYSENHTFKSITAKREYSADIPDGVDLDGGAYFGAELDATFQPTGEFAPIPAFNFKKTIDHEQTSQEFQFLGSFMNGQLSYVAGYYDFNEKGKEINPWKIGIFTGQGANLYFDEPLQWGGFYQVEADAQAYFAQVDYQLNDNLNVAIGVRHSKDEKLLIQLSEPDPMLRQDLSAKQDWDKTVGSLIVNYKANNDTSYYAKVVHGYAAGVFNPGTVDRFAYLNPANGGEANFEGSLIPGNPEDTLSYELGAKMFLLDDRLMLNTALFMNDNTNLLVTVFDGTIQRALNSGESETIGIEVDAQFAATPDLILSGSYGYRDTKYNLDEFVDQNRFSATFALDWTIAEIAYGDINLHMNYVMNDDNMFNNNDPTLVGKAYNLLNARLSLGQINVGQRATLDFALYGKNITDEEYTIHGANFSFYDASTYGTPATYGIDVKLTY